MYTGPQLSSVKDVTQNSCARDGNSEWCIISLHIFSERRWFLKIARGVIEQNDLVIPSRSNHKRGRVQHLHVQTAFYFKTLGLIRLSRILSYRNHESSKFQIEITVRAWSHEPGKQWQAWWLHAKFSPAIPANWAGSVVIYSQSWFCCA